MTDRGVNLMPVTLAVILALAFIRPASADIKVTLRSGEQIEMESFQIFYRESSMEPLTEPLTANVTFDIEQSTQRFLLIYQDLPIEQQVFDAQQNGCLGVILASSFSVVGGYLQYRVNDQQVANQIAIPVVEVGFIQFGAGLGSELLLSLANDDKIQAITILPDTTDNPWQVVMSSGWMYVWTVTIVLFCWANVGLAVLQLIKFYRYYGGCTQSIANYVLGIEITSNLLRFIGAIDFFGSNYLYPEWAAACLGELCLPFVVTSFLLFTLYWHELMTNATVVVHPFITKMRIPFFVISGFILAVQIIKTIVRNMVTFNSVNIITAAFYVAAMLFISIFYTVTAIKLLVRLHKSKHLGRTVNLTKSTIKVLVSGIFIFIFVVLAILFATGIPYNPVGYVVTWYVTYTCINVSSLMNILAFELPSKSSSSTGSRHKNTQHSHTMADAASKS